MGLFCFSHISDTFLFTDSFITSRFLSMKLEVAWFLLFSSNERSYRKGISGTTLTMISIDYPQQLSGVVGVDKEGTAKDRYFSVAKKQ